MIKNFIKWNNYHLDILQSPKPKCITKIGTTEAVYISEHIKTNGESYNPKSYGLNMSCGVYCKDKDSHNLWCKSYLSGIKTSDYLHLFHEANFKRLGGPNRAKRLENQWTDSFIYNKIKNEMNLSHEPTSDLDFVIMPFGLMKDAWHYNLKNKKILVVSSSEKSFRYQAKRFDKIWDGAELGGFEFVKIPSSEYLTKDNTNNQLEWCKKVENAKEEISKKDFDFAMLGCGGIGLVLIDFIKNQLGKSCTYLGGSLQLYFGIRGNRWENSKNGWYNSNEYWIKTFEEDIPKNYKIHENGSYWVK